MCITWGAIRMNRLSIDNKADHLLADQAAFQSNGKENSTQLCNWLRQLRKICRVKNIQARFFYTNFFFASWAHNCDALSCVQLSYVSQDRKIAVSFDSIFELTRMILKAGGRTKARWDLGIHQLTGHENGQSLSRLGLLIGIKQF